LIIVGIAVSQLLGTLAQAVSRVYAFAPVALGFLLYKLSLKSNAHYRKYSTACVPSTMGKASTFWSLLVLGLAALSGLSAVAETWRRVWGDWKIVADQDFWM